MARYSRTPEQNHRILCLCDAHVTVLSKSEVLRVSRDQPWRLSLVYRTWGESRAVAFISVFIGRELGARFAFLESVSVLFI